MKRTILIIDDDPISRQIVSKCLEPSGYRVHHASDGEGGLYSLTHEAIDAVLLDQKMPKLDGIVSIRCLALRRATRRCARGCAKARGSTRAAAAGGRQWIS